MEVREGGLFVTTTSCSDTREFRFTRGISLPVMSDVTAPPFCWRIVRILIPPKSGGLLPLCQYLGMRQDLPVPTVGDATDSARNDASPTFENTGDPLLLLGRRGGRRRQEDRVVSFDVDSLGCCLPYFRKGRNCLCSRVLPPQEQAAQREEAYARATVAFTRAQQICFIMGPLDMRGLVGAYGSPVRELAESIHHCPCLKPTLLRRTVPQGAEATPHGGGPAQTQADG